MFPAVRELGIEPWERDVESIMHRGVVVVEFFVAMGDFRVVQAFVQDARAVVQVLLIARATIEVDPAQ